MRATQTSSLAALASLFLSQLVSAQTSTKCNPLHQQCPADPALGTTKSIDFTSGQSSDFTSTGPVSYEGANGAVLTIAKSGDSPTLTSNWYLMFGRVDVELKAAPGTGIVSSFVMESDDLDEIDWELLGSQPDQIQTNYFGKGQTGSYDRGSTSNNPGGTSSFHTYTVDWSSEQIVWQINGQTVRTLQPQNANGQYPQTPMQLKLGAWAGGDSSNAPGVVAWAGGSTQYSQGPFKMYIKSVKATDYSTGKTYSYSGTDGSWGQVKADGGSVSGGSTHVDASSSSSAGTTSTSGQPVPFDGTHAQPSQSFTTPSVYPWVSGPAPSSASGSSSVAAHPIMPESSATPTPVGGSSGSSPAAPSAGSAAGGNSGAAAAAATASPTAPFPVGGGAGGSSPSYGGAGAYAAPSSGFSTTASGNGTIPSATARPSPSSFQGAAGRTNAGIGAAFAGALGCVALAL